ERFSTTAWFGAAFLFPGSRLERDGPAIPPFSSCRLGGANPGRPGHHQLDRRLRQTAASPLAVAADLAPFAVSVGLYLVVARLVAMEALAAGRGGVRLSGPGRALGGRYE